MSFTGYRIYRGQGGIENVDFTAPVAATIEANVSLVGLGHEPGRTYCYLVRPVLDGRERPDVACRTELRFDQSGRLCGPRPARPVLLSAKAETDAVELVWCQGPDPSAPTCPVADSLIYLSRSGRPGEADPVAVVAWSPGQLQRRRVNVAAGTWHAAIRLRDADGSLSVLSAVARVRVGTRDAMCEQALIEQVNAR